MADLLGGLNPATRQDTQRQQQNWTQAQIDQANALAQALQEKALSDKPIFSPWAGAARLADALVGNITQNRQANAQRQWMASQADNPTLSLGVFPGSGGASPAAPSGTGPQASTGADVTMDEAKAGIHSVESADNPNPYADVGPTVKVGQYRGDHAVGKYQVMASDLPQKLADAGLPQMTEEQFKANPQAQELQFEHEFGGLLRKHGNFNDAASVWFTGRPYAQALRQHANDQHIGVQAYVEGANQGVLAYRARQGGGQPGNPLQGPANAPVSAQPGAQYVAGNRSPTPMALQPGLMQPGAAQAAAFGMPPGGGPVQQPRQVSTVAGQRPMISVAQAQPPAAAPAQQAQQPYAPGSYIPGAIPPDQIPALKAKIAEMIRDPARNQQGLQWLERITDKPMKLQTGHTVLGNEWTGYRVTGLPGLPEMGPHIKTPIGEIPTVLPNSQGLTVPSGTLPDWMQPGAGSGLAQPRSLGAASDKSHSGNPKEDAKKLYDYLFGSK